MLRWRLLLGTLIVGLLVGLCWLDHGAKMPGAWLLPVALVFATMAGSEMLYLTGSAGMRPLPWAVYGGNLAIVASGWLPTLFPGAFPSSDPLAALMWPMVALALAFVAVFLGEMRRYEKPGGVTTNIAAAVLSLVYVGGLLSFVVQLRLVWGIGALATLVLTVKMGDTGAYTVGRLFGRHKMAPVLSPGKTIEGAAGGLFFACLGSWIAFTWLVPRACNLGEGALPSWGWVLFGVVVGVTGLLGDLAESLIKRDVGCKDSSRWLPGFGGVLDLLDSILLAAPVAWGCWALMSRI